MNALKEEKSCLKEDRKEGGGSDLHCLKPSMSVLYCASGCTRHSSTVEKKSSDFSHSLGPHPVRTGHRKLAALG